MSCLSLGITLHSCWWTGSSFLSFFFSYFFFFLVKKLSGLCEILILLCLEEKVILKTIFFFGCQWWNLRFLWSLSWVSYLSPSISGCLNWFSLSSFGQITTRLTFCHHLASYHGYNCLWHCISGEQTTASRLWTPLNTQAHMLALWNRCISASSRNTHLPVLVING